jgi:ketosteroid isomerase-like protein
MRPLLILAAICFTNWLAPTSFAQTSASQSQIQQRLQEIFNAAEKKDFVRLDSYHLYGPKFTKFGSGGLTRQHAEAARQAEHAGLSRLTGLSMRADDLKIDVFGDSAVVTFIVRATAKTDTQSIQSVERSTLVFVKDAGSWKIVHEHFSPLREATTK